MKKLLLALCVVSFFIGCNKESVVDIPEVEFTLDFTFAESGSMSRSGSTVYNEFYEKHIKTKELTPDKYTLNFSQGDERVATFNGKWDLHQVAKLPKGKYLVTGVSGVDSDFSSDAQLIFNEEIELDENTTNISLNAEYNCFLLLFDNTSIKSASYWCDYNKTTNSYYSKITDLTPVDNIYYIFLCGNKDDRAVKYTIDNTASVIHLSNFEFKKGFYYYFNDITNSFDIPPMGCE